MMYKVIMGDVGRLTVVYVILANGCQGHCPDDIIVLYYEPFVSK